MTYKMKVTIKDPQMKERKQLMFTCYFMHDPDTYGNGYHVNIMPDRKEYGKHCYDLRYDKTFNRENPLKWLIEWAYNYWSGENGAWEVNTLEINTLPQG